MANPDQPETKASATAEKSAHTPERVFKYNADEVINRLVAQRDELLAAGKLALFKLEEMAQLFGDKWPLDLSPVKAETRLRSAIAKVEGSAQ